MHEHKKFKLVALDWYELVLDNNDEIFTSTALLTKLKKERARIAKKVSLNHTFGMTTRNPFIGVDSRRELLKRVKFRGIFI